MQLRMNLGDPSEVRVYYLPHLVAQHAGLFAREGLTVSFSQSGTGGHTINGGQVPAVISGDADLTIGGAMVTMKHAEEGIRLVNFCAAVCTNTWFVLGRVEDPDFTLAHLAGHDVLDIANVGTASFIFDEIVESEGIATTRISGPEGGNIEGWLASDQAYAIHHLHAAAPAIASKRVAALASLAQSTGEVPWSTYIARPDVMAANPESFRAFRKGIAAALEAMEALSSDALATMVEGDFPDLTHKELVVAIDLGRLAGLWPQDPAVPRDDFERFGKMLVQAGWLSQMPNWHALTIEEK